MVILGPDRILCKVCKKLCGQDIGTKTFDEERDHVCVGGSAGSASVMSL